MCRAGGTPLETGTPCNHSFSVLLKFPFSWKQAKGSCLQKALPFPAEGCNSTSAVLTSLFKGKLHLNQHHSPVILTSFPYSPATY